MDSPIGIIIIAIDHVLYFHSNSSRRNYSTVEETRSTQISYN
jgi:hypothetical protein